MCCIDVRFSYLDKTHIEVNVRVAIGISILVFPLILVIVRLYGYINLRIHIGVNIHTRSCILNLTQTSGGSPGHIFGLQGQEVSWAGWRQLEKGLPRSVRLHRPSGSGDKGLEPEAETCLVVPRWSEACGSSSTLQVQEEDYTTSRVPVENFRPRSMPAGLRW